MILLDDNFASIVKGIEEGRLIFVNLKKSIQYTISHSTPEVIPNLLYVIIPIPLPLSAILILAIDLGFELIAALSFAWDPPETKEGLMKVRSSAYIVEIVVLTSASYHLESLSRQKLRTSFAVERFVKHNLISMKKPASLSHPRTEPKFRSTCTP